MRKLLMGIVDFRERLLPEYAAHFRELSEGQSPDTLFITCSDSRVVPDLLISTDPGELFVMRNVGNLVPPSTVEGSSTGDVSEASAIEYASLILKVQNIVICGHSECGAMEAALADRPSPQTPNLTKWLHHTSSAVYRLEQEGPLDASLGAANQLSQLNVLVQLEHLMSYPIVQQRVRLGEVQLSGWWFNIAGGEMLAYQRTSRTFEPIDRRTAESFISQLESGSR